MFEKEAIIHAFEATIGIECLNKPIEDFTYEELSDEQQEKAYDFKKGAEFGYNKANEWHKVADGDLPKHTRYVWTNVGPSYYDDDRDSPCWRDEFGRTQGVIAWCEPKFKE